MRERNSQAIGFAMAFPLSASRVSLVVTQRFYPQRGSAATPGRAHPTKLCLHGARGSVACCVLHFAGCWIQRKANFNQGWRYLPQQPLILLDIRNSLTRQRNNCQAGLSTFRSDYLEHLNAEVTATADRLHDRVWVHTDFIAVWRAIY